MTIVRASKDGVEVHGSGMGSPFVVAHPLSLMQRVLLSTDGTVTHLLSLYAEEPIVIRKLSPTVPEAGADRILFGNAVTSRRQVLLAGDVSGENFLYAETLVANSRLPRDVRMALVGTNEPIGTVLSRTRCETYREILEVATEPMDGVANHFPYHRNACLLARRYAVFERHRAVMLITEKFPCTLFSDQHGANARCPLAHDPDRDRADR
jgi:chorismate-pyruvate lyase